MGPAVTTARSQPTTPRAPAVQVSRTAVRLSLFVALLGGAAASVGLLWTGGALPVETVTTVRGEAVHLYGVGLYRFESLHGGPVYRGTDAVALFLGVPLLAYAAHRYRRGSTRWTLLLAAALLWFLYQGLSLSLSAAYNELYLVYVLLVASSGTGLALVLRSLPPSRLATQVSEGFPRRGMSTFLTVVVGVTILLWGGLAVEALASGQPPGHLEHATTTVEETLSLGLLVPAFVVAALALRRGEVGLGVLLGVPLLVLVASLAPVVTAQTMAQLLAGVTLPPEALVGLVASWLVLGAVAMGILVRALRHVRDDVADDTPAA
jgi:hypothetical protein